MNRHLWLPTLVRGHAAMRVPTAMAADEAARTLALSDSARLLDANR
jgi:hypothetical protein